MITESVVDNSSIYLLKTNDSEDNNDIEELLKPVDELSLGSVSDYSEVTDIFEEYHMGSYLRTNADPYRRHLSKREADWRTVEHFTDDFKKAMGDVREELQVVNQPLFEEEQAIEEVLNKPPVSNKSRTQNRDSPIIIEPQKSLGSEASSESLVWQRLLNNCEGHFMVSPPIFDAFRQKEVHWLERPPISWKLVDECRVKCERWLDDVMPAGGEY